MDRKSKGGQFNKCLASQGSGKSRNKDNKCDSALSGVTHHDGYRGKICDIWQRKDDEKLFLDWLNEVKKEKSLLKRRRNYLKITKPYVVTHSCIVELIFKMCKDLNQPADTRYRTVELFDRFVAYHFMDLVKVGLVGRKEDSLAEWNASLPRSSSRTLLRVVSCIQLASKYCAHCTIVSPKKAYAYLQKRGQSCEIKNILASEVRVFKALDYDIGVPTLLVFVDILLPLLRETIQDKVYTVCLSMIDVIYLRRHELYKKLGEKLLSKWHQAPPDKLSCVSYEFDGLYCAAACILSAIQVYYPKDSRLTNIVSKKLCRFVERPEPDIVTFSALIIQMIGLVAAPYKASLREVGAGHTDANSGIKGEKIGRNFSNVMVVRTHTSGILS